MTTLPDHAPEVWRLAADADKLMVLASLAGLPSQTPTDHDATKITYLIALKGTYHYALFRARDEIAQGRLGHPYFPSPSELRMEHDRIMRPWIEAREKESERKRRVEWAEDRDAKPFEPNSAASRARVAAIYREFCRTWPSQGRAEAPPSVVLDPDKLAKIPDAPRPARQVGELLRTPNAGAYPGGGKTGGRP
ncbi:hypothetical protein [Mesorhizobium sp. M1378]|uniref:hypothetical protein n=1 Tax=Mesorhizobium sp. M1378 TaxID=2957092 RepID=UPI0033368325